MLFIASYEYYDAPGLLISVFLFFISTDLFHLSIYGYVAMFNIVWHVFLLVFNGEEFKKKSISSKNCSISGESFRSRQEMWFDQTQLRFASGLFEIGSFSCGDIYWKSDVCVESSYKMTRIETV